MFIEIGENTNRVFEALSMLQWFEAQLITWISIYRSLNSNLLTFQNTFSKSIGLWDQNRDADGNVLINYDFALGNTFSDDFKTLFTDAVEWFHRETCLRFVEIEPSDDADFLGPVFIQKTRFWSMSIFRLFELRFNKTKYKTHS